MLVHDFSIYFDSLFVFKLMIASSQLNFDVSFCFYNDLLLFERIILKVIYFWSLVKIHFSDNVLTCNCQKNNTWVWIQDHPKIIKSDTVTCLNDDIPKEKCNVPVISQLSVDKHKDNSVSVSWFIRNRTAIKALQILYYSEDVYSEVSCFQIDYR